MNMLASALLAGLVCLAFLTDAAPTDSEDVINAYLRYRASTDQQNDQVWEQPDWQHHYFRAVEAGSGVEPEDENEEKDEDEEADPEVTAYRDALQQAFNDLEKFAESQVSPVEQAKRKCIVGYGLGHFSKVLLCVGPLCVCE